jgi:hypothetical protein
MKMLLVSAGLACAINCLGLAKAATLFTVPVMIVTPTNLDFGTVTEQTTATNSFLVENAGGGTLVGKVTVAAPFKIISGDTYSLKSGEIQIVTITYSPSEAEKDVQTAEFSGAKPVTAKVIGKRGPPRPKQVRRP